MSVLSLAEARSFDALASASDIALQMAIEDVESEIVARFGPYYPAVYVEVVPSSRIPERGPIVLARRLSSITSIVETLAYAGTPVPTRTLDPTDYRLRGYYLVDRLASGPTPAYGWSRYGLEISGIPIDDTSRRKMATIDVLKAEVGFSGMGSFRIGEYSESSASAGGGPSDVTSDRAKILRRLRPKAMVLR